jgi:hypothetical protein
LSEPDEVLLLPDLSEFPEPLEDPSDFPEDEEEPESDFFSDFDPDDFFSSESPDAFAEVFGLERLSVA